MKRLPVISVLVMLLATALLPAMGQDPKPKSQRRATPINTAATRTQSRNDAEGDSARALERKKARSIQFTDESGKIVMVDTVTGLEWVDSTLLPKAPPMIYPLFHSINVGVNIFDPVMRAFGQHYGGADAFVNVSLHNRYFPTFEFGMGAADNTPETGNYTYHTPLSPYFKIGCDYNFFYNSNPDYKLYALARYGFSPFKYSLTDVTLNDPYWGETSKFDVPSQSVTAGWFEVGVGIQVKLWGHVSAGWAIRYHSVLHRSHPSTGDAWYIPGYGSSTSSLSAAFNIIYTIPFPERKKPKAGNAYDPDGGAPLQERKDGPAQSDSIDAGTAEAPDSVPAVTEEPME